jgi:putative phosphoribosyl transferase
MYFKSRTEAGLKLAEMLKKYRYENVAVIALGLGSVVVAEPIAVKLHSLLGMFFSEPINIPGEGVTIGTVGQGGHYVNNPKLSVAEVEDYYSEYHGTIEDNKREKFTLINRLIADGGSLDVNLLHEHVIILVSDGLQSGDALAAVGDFLRPVSVKRLVIATPVASVQGVDAMHIAADELHCLGVTENYIGTQHYYDLNDVPTRKEAVDKINNAVLNWA